LPAAVAATGTLITFCVGVMPFVPTMNLTFPLGGL
jgi:hypothetical protein